MKAITAKARKRNLEDQHQIALIQWSQHARLTREDVEPGSTISDYLFHIPNGGKRSKVEAAILKGMGTKAGVSDLFLPLPCAGYHGLWVEMKAPYNTSKDKNYPSKEQKEWIAKMTLAGYQTAVCYGWFDAKAVILNYLKGDCHEAAA